MGIQLVSWFMVVLVLSCYVRVSKTRNPFGRPTDEQIKAHRLKWSQNTTNEKPKEPDDVGEENLDYFSEDFLQKWEKERPRPAKIDSCVPVKKEDVQIAFLASSQAYNKTNIGQKIKNTGFTVVNVVEVELTFKPLKVIVLKGVQEGRGEVTIVSFMGSEGFFHVKQQVLYSWLISKIPWNITESDDVLDAAKLFFKAHHPKIYTYFWMAFGMLGNKKAVEDWVPGGITPGGRYIITGHSLGGALASIYSLYMKMTETGMWNNENTALITFGQPRVGDEAYANLHDKLISPHRKLRIVYKNDLVAVIPYRGFHHHSRKVWLYDHWNPDWKVWHLQTYFCPLGDDPDPCERHSNYKAYSDHNLEVEYSKINRFNWTWNADNDYWTSFERAQCLK